MCVADELFVLSPTQMSFLTVSADVSGHWYSYDSRSQELPEVYQANGWTSAITSDDYSLCINIEISAEVRLFY